MRCFVPYCQNDNHMMNARRFRFHVFPKNVVLRSKWLKAIRRQDETFDINQSRRICSEHFLPSDYYVSGEATLLHKNVVPSIFSWPAAAEHKENNVEKTATSVDCLRRENVEITSPVVEAAANAKNKQKQSHHNQGNSYVWMAMSSVCRSNLTDAPSSATHPADVHAQQQVTDFLRGKMVYACCVPSCNNNGKVRSVSLHSFTRDPALKKMWINRINLDTQMSKLDSRPMTVNSVTKYTKICSAHFRKSDITVGSGLNRLNPDAVPAIFPWTTKRIFRQAQAKQKEALLESLQELEQLTELEQKLEGYDTRASRAANDSQLDVSSSVPQENSSKDDSLSDTNTQ